MLGRASLTWISFKKLIEVPIIMPINPITIIKISWKINNLQEESDFSDHFVQKWIIAGKIIPKADNENAPNIEINMSKEGTIMANKTENKK